MRRAIQSMRTATVLGLTVASAACGGDDAGTEPVLPTPGVLTVELATPNATEAAVLFEITGPSVEEVDPSSAGVLLESSTSGTTTTIALFGSIQSGPIAQITVPDTRASYTVQLQQLAGPDNALRTNLQAYELTIGE